MFTLTRLYALKFQSTESLEKLLYHLALDEFRKRVDMNFFMTSYTKWNLPNGDKQKENRGLKHNYT